MAEHELVAGSDDPTLALVDVPGHERFIATMLAGLGPAPAVLFVVAADEGWRRQSAEHLAAIDALGLTYGLLVVTRADLADPRDALTQARAELARSSLGSVPAVAVSGTTGAGLSELRTALARLVHRLPQPTRSGRIRLWLDRSFTIRGAGTVVTGTLSAGTLREGDELELNGRAVRIRGLQSLGAPCVEVTAPARVAVNLRGIEVEQVGRGDALLTPHCWHHTATLDVGCSGVVAELPGEVMVHLGTSTVPARVRPLGTRTARLIMEQSVPVELSDRLVLRDPGLHAVLGGAVVLDPDPPELRRRGAARARAEELERLSDADTAAVLAAQVARRGAVRRSDLTALGFGVDDPGPVVVLGEWLVDPTAWRAWRAALSSAVQTRATTTPLDPRLPIDAARQLLGLPARDLVLAAAAAVGLTVQDGRIFRPGSDLDGLGAAEPGLRALEAQLAERPFLAPERPDLQAWGLGPRELAAAERTGRIVRLGSDVVVLPTGPALAMRTLSGLPQPFTASQAREALGTTRRVVIPLLEQLDRRGWTIRVDDRHRRIQGR